MKNPDIFLFDEITNSLDFSSKNKINLLHSLKESIRKNSIWASHDTSEIIDLCNKVIILEKGEVARIIFKGEDDFNERILISTFNRSLAFFKKDLINQTSYRLSFS